MKWEYRLVEFDPPHCKYQVMEVYFDDKGKPYATGNPFNAAEETVADLKSSLDWMYEKMVTALDKPVIHIKDIGVNND